MKLSRSWNVKKWGTLMLTAVLLAASSGGEKAAAAHKDMKVSMPLEVLYDGRKMQFDVPPKMVNNSVLVPIRFVSDKLGGKLAVNGKKITITKGKQVLQITMNSKTAAFNGKTVQLNQAAIVDRGRTLVPLRAVSEGLGVKVEWDKVTQFVWIGKKEVPELKDLIKPVKSEPYKKYFKGRKFFYKHRVDGVSSPATQAYVIDANDLPVAINGEHFYRYDLASYKDGTKFIQATTTDKGSMATQIYYLNYASKLRYRATTTSYQENIGDFRIHYYPVVDSTDETAFGDKNYTKYKVEIADYVGIAAGYPGLVLIKNPFKKE
ncbi:copper amine oxidase N-terminal domain-containing protein [Paenibacillaceae bacterium]|nr:copper amine oxidase N-terminal domain-containing protein [Paenibacillaceae bacterium]